MQLIQRKTNAIRVALLMLIPTLCGCWFGTAVLDDFYTYYIRIPRFRNAHNIPGDWDLNKYFRLQLKQNLSRDEVISLIATWGDTKLSDLRAIDRMDPLARPGVVYIEHLRIDYGRITEYELLYDRNLQLIDIFWHD